MTQLTLSVPESTFSAFKWSPEDFAVNMKITALVKWYEEGLISQSKATEIAGISRQEFLKQLYKYNVSPYQISNEDLINEVS